MRYILMNKNTPVLELKITVNTIVEKNKMHNLEYMPVGVKANLPELNKWWKGRAIPASRDGIKEALSTLHVGLPEDLILKSFGLSLSDQYWVKPESTELRWKDINFFDNDFSNDVGEAIFNGIRSNKKDLDLKSPDNTSDGWLKKKWIIKDGKRYLVKAGSEPFEQEPYNEVIATAIFDKLSILSVQYMLEHVKSKKSTTPCSICENFITPDTELVTAWQVLELEKKSNNVSQYQHLINIVNKLEIQDAQKNIDSMLTVDYIIANSDRHYGNFGFIRDVNTLKYIGTAPIYDSGTSLWHNAIKIIPGRPPESKPFYDSHERQIDLVKDFSFIDLAKLQGIDEVAREILKDNDNIGEERRTDLCNALNYRIEKLQSHINKMKKSLN